MHNIKITHRANIIHLLFARWRVKMLLHHHYHSGHGFGSFFGKLFSKIAAKTVAKSIGKVASKAAKVGARKVVKAATSATARNIAKKAAKKGSEKAFEAVSEYAAKKIDSLGNAAINNNVPPQLVHNVQTAVKRGARSELSNLKDSVINKIDTGIDNSVEPVRKKFRIDADDSSNNVQESEEEKPIKKTLSYIIDQLYE